MDEKRRQGYLAGLVCLSLAALLIIVVRHVEWSGLGHMLWMVVTILLLMGLTAFAKPDAVGGGVLSMGQRVARVRPVRSGAPHRHRQPRASKALHPAETQTLKRSEPIRADNADRVRVYSYLYGGIQRMTRAYTRDLTREMAVGGFVKVARIDANLLSTLFQQYQTVVRRRDRDMWQEIAQEIHAKGGFVISRSRQQWLEDVVAEYHRLKDVRR